MIFFSTFLRYWNNINSIVSFDFCSAINYSKARRSKNRLTSKAIRQFFVRTVRVFKAQSQSISWFQKKLSSMRKIEGCGYEASLHGTYPAFNSKAPIWLSSHSGEDFQHGRQWVGCKWYGALCVSRLGSSLGFRGMSLAERLPLQHCLARHSHEQQELNPDTRSKRHS